MKRIISILLIGASLATISGQEEVAPSPAPTLPSEAITFYKINNNQYIIDTSSSNGTYVVRKAPSTLWVVWVVLGVAAVVFGLMCCFWNSSRQKSF